MYQNKKPMYESLINHINKNPISFHVPGHKYGMVFPAEESIPYFQQLLKLDATELSGLDDLHAPEGPIAEAEALLANLYNVKKSFFLVNGSTSGNLAMIMSVCQEDQIVLVQRNCHKSILHALKLAKVKPVFLEPEYDPEWKVAAGVPLETVKEAIALYPNAQALILTYPTYYGIAYGLNEMVDLAHQHHIPVLVDEAHGAHFIIGSPIPKSAVLQGADIVVQSAHKTLPAMTMGSYLHVNSELVNVNRLEEYLHIFQSSSPSYPIMASLDLARNYLENYQRTDLEYLLDEIKLFRKGLGEIPGITVLDYSSAGGDPLKVTIQSEDGASGFSLQKRFEAFGIYSELADPVNVLLVLPLLKANQNYPFEEALEKIKMALENGVCMPQKKIAIFKNKAVSTLSLGYKEMDKVGVVDIPISQAAGRIAAEMIIPYPPGIPLLLEGETISQERLECLMTLMQLDAKFQGGTFLKQNRLKVFEQDKRIFGG